MTRRNCPLQAHAPLWHRSCGHGAEVDDGARVMERSALLCERPSLATGHGNTRAGVVVVGDHYPLPATAAARDPCKRETCELGSFR